MALTTAGCLLLVPILPLSVGASADVVLTYLIDDVTGSVILERQGSYASTIRCTTSWVLVDQAHTAAGFVNHRFILQVAYSSGSLVIGHARNGALDEWTFSCSAFSLDPIEPIDASQTLDPRQAIGPPPPPPPPPMMMASSPATAAAEMGCVGNKYFWTGIAPRDGAHQRVNPVLEPEAFYCIEAAGSQNTTHVPFTGRAYLSVRDSRGEFLSARSTCYSSSRGAYEGTMIAGGCWENLDRSPFQGRADPHVPGYQTLSLDPRPLRVDHAGGYVEFVTTGGYGVRVDAG